MNALSTSRYILTRLGTSFTVILMAATSYTPLAQTSASSSSQVVSGGTETVRQVGTYQGKARQSSTVQAAVDAAALDDQSQEVNIAPSTNPVEVGFAPQDVGTASEPKTVTLQNDTPTDFQLQTIDTSSPDYRITENGCPARLVHGGGTCPIKVIFTPFRTGNVESTLVVNYKSTDPKASPLKVTLRGTGLPWEFPSMRAVAGTDVSAATSKQTSQQYFLEFTATAPLGKTESARADPVRSKNSIVLKRQGSAHPVRIA